jgi:hypothetical protein
MSTLYIKWLQRTWRNFALCNEHNAHHFATPLSQACVPGMARDVWGESPHSR